MSHCRIYPLIAMAGVLLWQFATVNANYGGNWTALYYTGALRPVPPALDGEHIYTFPGSYGFDGQLYHYIAHDPFFQRGFDPYVDEPRLRYGRILVPALAYLLAGGRQEWVDPAYMAVCLVFLGLGVYWLSEWVRRQNRNPALGLLFVLLPAVLVSIDRLVADVALAALAAGFLLYSERPPSWKLLAILVAAPLARETGLFLIAGYCVYLLTERNWKPACLFAITAFPWLVWSDFVDRHTRPFEYGASWVPLSAIVRSLLHLQTYPQFEWLVRAGDELALIGMLLAFVLAAGWVLRKPFTPAAIAGISFALLGVFLQRPENWQQVYDYGRVYTPLLLFLAAEWIRGRSWLFLVPWVMVLARTAMQFGAQILGILHAR